MIRLLRKSTALGGGDISGITITNADLTYSESFSPDNNDEVGIVVSLGATSTGTNPTCAAALQFSPDGVHWGAVAQDSPSATASSTGALAKGTSVSIEACQYWKLPVAESNSVASNPLYRFAFTYANADNDFDTVSMWLALRQRGGNRRP